MSVVYSVAKFTNFGDYADHVRQQHHQMEVDKPDDSDFSAIQRTCAGPGYRILAMRTTGSMIRRGAWPGGTTTFGFARRRPKPMYWCGRELSSLNELAIFPGSEYINVTRSSLDAYGMTFTGDFLDQVAESEEKRPTGKSKKNALGRIFLLSESGVGNLESLAEDLLNPLSINPAAQTAHDMASSLLADTVADVPRRHPGSNTRLRAFKRARDFMHAFAAEEISIRDIARNTGMSARTLTYAFNEHTGMPPMRYLKVYRLNRLRNSLREATPGGTRVSDLANEWGFWHLGKLAADYREMFGVTPAEDLRGMPMRW